LFLSFLIIIALIAWQNRYYTIEWDFGGDFLGDRLLKGRRGNILGHGLHVLDGYNLLGLIMILVLERSSSHEVSGRYDGCDGRLNVLAGFWDGFTRWYDDGLWECGYNFSFVLFLGILNRLIPIYCSFYTIQHSIYQSLTDISLMLPSIGAVHTGPNLMRWNEFL
jgi:hypothetical protein